MIITTTVVETGEVEGLVAIAAGQEQHLHPGQSVIFRRAGDEIGRGRTWFCLDSFSSVRIEQGTIETGDRAIVFLDEVKPL